MTGDGTVIASIAAGVAHNGAAQANAASTSDDHTVTYNNVGPTVTINQAVGQADPTAGSTINFTVVFSESVLDFATGDVTLSGGAGATTATVTGSGTIYNVAVTGMTTDGTVIATIGAGVAHNGAAQANAASSSTDNTVTRDTTGPTVTINQAVGQADPTSASPINFTVVFNESVADFAAADVTLGGTAGATTAIVTGSGTTYNVAVSGMDTDGTVTASIAAGVAHDTAGNASGGSTSTDNEVTWSDPAPTATVDEAVGQLDPTSDPEILFTVVFSEPVTGLAAGDFNVGGSAASSVTNVAGSGATYTVTVTATSAGTVTLDLPGGTVVDLGGKANTAATPIDNSVTEILMGADVDTAQYKLGNAGTWTAFPGVQTQFSATYVSDTDLRVRVLDQFGDPLLSTNVSAVFPRYERAEVLIPLVKTVIAPDSTTTDGAGYLYWSNQGTAGAMYYFVRLGLDLDGVLGVFDAI